MFEDDEPLQEEEAEVFVLQEENEEEEQEEADKDQTVQEDEDKGISYWTECDGRFTFHRNEDCKLVN